MNPTAGLFTYVTIYQCFHFPFRLVSFLCTVIIDFSVGLVAGITAAILSVVLRGFWVKGQLLKAGQGHTELYIPNGMYDNYKTGSMVKVFRYESSLYFTTVADFRKQLFEVALDPKRMNKLLTKIQSNLAELTADDVEVVMESSGKPDIPEWYGNKTPINKKGKDKPKTLSVADTSATIQTAMSRYKKSLQGKGAVKSVDLRLVSKMMKMSAIQRKLEHVTAVIVDCSAISYCDVMGLNTIDQLNKEYKEVNIPFVLANVNSSLIEKLEVRGLYKRQGSDLLIYATVHDAVMAFAAEGYRDDMDLVDIDLNTSVTEA